MFSSVWYVKVFGGFVSMCACLVLKTPNGSLLCLWLQRKSSEPHLSTGQLTSPFLPLRLRRTRKRGTKIQSQDSLRQERKKQGKLRKTESRNERKRKTERNFKHYKPCAQGWKATSVVISI